MEILVVTVTLAALLYFLPYIIAGFSNKRSGCAIGVLNLFLGWTLIGWVIALVWALSKDPEIKIKNVVAPQNDNTNQESDTQKIEKLAELKNKGLITEEEFKKKKAKILGIEE